MAEKIIVGREYAAAFDSAYALLESGCLDGVYRAVNAHGVKRIEDGVHVFELGSENGADESDEIFLGSDGASWFAALRNPNGEQKVNQGAIWTQFIDSLAKAYHKKYSLIEYEQMPIDEKKAEENRRVLALYANRICRTLLGDYFANPEVIMLPQDESAEDIYGAYMRLELSNGTGVAVPVLCKVYFKMCGERLEPMPTSEANRIDDYLKSLDGTDGAAIRGGDKDSRIIDKTLNALEALISGKNKDDKDGNFARYMFLGNSESEDEDVVSVERLVNSVSGEKVALRCMRVTVFGVYHIRWSVVAANVKFGARSFLRLAIDENKKITLSCLNCKDGAELVENNSIMCKTEDGHSWKITLNPELDDLGLSKEDVAKIRKSSAFASHLIKISCTGNSRNPACSAIRCESQTLRFGTDKNPELKCENCPYPEIVYRDENGVLHDTSKLAFARDAGKMMEKDKLRVCVSCGRTFTDSGMSRHDKGLCSLCASSDSDDSVSAKKTYRRYAGMLSPMRRMQLGRHRCYEDGEIILFAIGNKKYIFKKLDEKQTGYLKAPVRVVLKRKGDN